MCNGARGCVMERAWMVMIRGIARCCVLLLGSRFLVQHTRTASLHTSLSLSLSLDHESLAGYLKPRYLDQARHTHTERERDPFVE